MSTEFNNLRPAMLQGIKYSWWLREAWDSFAAVYKHLYTTIQDPAVETDWITIFVLCLLAPFLFFGLPLVALGYKRVAEAETKVKNYLIFNKRIAQHVNMLQGFIDESV